ncbi:hypothetical protein AB0I68_03810 [Streptomyces sp. NPDC050448]|uniref:hypothetical protein n=1 Tax=Streptomyces sp. NPDC050448 TaxID=3155404 RepID=UPI0034215D65
MPGKDARHSALTDQRYARIMEKADAIQARQHREDEQTSVVLGTTSIATLTATVSLMVTLIAADIPTVLIPVIMTVFSAIPGVVTLYLRFKNRH